MPSFVRLGKSANRSQQSVAAEQQQQQQQQQQQPSLPLSRASTAAAAASTAVPRPGSASGANGSGSTGAASASASASAGVAVAAAGLGGASSAAGGGGGGAGGNSGAGGGSGGLVVVAVDSTQDHTTPRSASSALSSQEPFVDTQQQQQQQLHHQSVQLQSHLFPPSTSGGVQNPIHAGSLESLHQQLQFGQQPQHQQQQQQQHQQLQHQEQLPPQDFASAAQSLITAQRHGTAQQQQSHPLKLEHLYGSVSTTSLDDLSGAAGYHQAQGATSPPPASTEKRSTRKLIKGIFAKATGIQDQGHHGHSQSQVQGHGQVQGQPTPARYDNTGGLARRPSKRSTDANRRQSLVARIQSDNNLIPQSSRIIPSLNTTIRKVTNDPEVPLSAYDEASHPPSLLSGPPSQPPQLQHLQLQHLQQQQPGHVQSIARVSHDQQVRYDHEQTSHDRIHSPTQPPGQQFHFPVNTSQDPYFQSSDGLMSNSYPGPGLTQQQVPQQNPETISQLSHDSHAQDVDQRHLPNQQILEHHNPSSLSLHYSSAVQSQDTSTATPSAILAPGTQQSTMAPATGAPPSRRTTELDRALPQLPAGYRPDASVAPATGSSPGAASSQPGQPPGAPSTQQHRGPDNRASQLDGTPPSLDTGRNSPQPSAAAVQERESENDKAFKELLTKYKHVKRLFFDGRAQIEQLSGQVEHLQNAVANQRMSSSRTALDDNEYSTRFSRLNGAINNLSFNIRKDWRSVPPWLEKYVSADALKTGKQEMTAVGRAVIARWVLEELFHKCFHPDLETALSAQLKEVELGIRASAPTMHSQEEVDAHTAKVVSWRMTTLDGLQQRLAAAGAAENRQLLISKATSNLTACLYQHLSNPPPHGVEGSTSTIVELAVSIAANLPKESRDVAVTYPMPGDMLQPHLMEVEKAGLPALEGQKTKTEGDAEAENKEAFSSDASRVRFAAFFALEVKGRQVLMKAPVWTM